VDQPRADVQRSSGRRRFVRVPATRFQRLWYRYPGRWVFPVVAWLDLLGARYEDGRIAKNPCIIKKARVEESIERKTATVADIDALVASMPKRFKIVVLLSAWCQLRRGEVLGLRRGDIDLNAGTISVLQTAQFTGDGSIIFGPPKTATGRRTVAMPAQLLSAV